MESAKRDFKGIWIPKEIWFDKRITTTEKIILMEIDSLDCSEQGCSATNEYLADMCQCSGSKVSKAISHLIELEYINMANFDGRTRFLKVCLAKNATLPSKKCYPADDEHNNIYSIVDGYSINNNEVESYIDSSRNNQVVSYSKNSEVERYIDNSKHSKELNILTKTQKSAKKENNGEQQAIDENFERLWQMLPPTQYDRKRAVKAKRKTELFDMSEQADRAIELYINTVNPQYHYKRDRFLNEIIDNYIGKTESDFINRNTTRNANAKSELESCYSALSAWASMEDEKENEQ